MEENTNQPSTTPLGNERRDNPGQTNIMYNSNGDSIVPTTPSWTDETPLEDIAKQYSGVGGKYNDLVENAADNVGDRQVQLVGNDFGATNPYMFNTYYEPAATAFASEMRMQGTQKALEEGLDRGEKEANNRLNAAKQRYENALAAAQKKAQEERKNAKVHVSETDKSRMAEDTTETEVNKFVDTTQNMSDEEKKQKWIEQGTQKIQQNSEKMSAEDWNAPWRSEYSTGFRRGYISDDDWNKMSHDEQQNWWHRTDIGNAWTEGYMKRYFKETYGEEAGKKMTEAFDDLKNDANIIVEAINKSTVNDLKNENFTTFGVKVDNSHEVKAELIKKAIQDTDKLTDKEKKDYLGAIEKSGTEEFMKMWDELESKRVTKKVTEGLFGAKMSSFERNDGTGVNQSLASKAYHIMQLFAGSEESLDMSPEEGEKSALLKYAGYDTVKDKLKVKEQHEQVEGQLATGSDKKVLSQNFNEAFGLDLRSWNNISKMKTERPEDYEYMVNQAAFVGAGGAASFEKVTDPDKKYFINGKYWSANDKDSPISVGDLIYHTIDGTVDSEGNYTSDDLKNFLELYQDIYTGKKDANDENMKALEKYYGEYNSDVLTAMFLAGDQGTGVNQNMFNVILAAKGKKNADKLEMTDPTDPNNKVSLSAIKQWFESMSDDAKYNTYTELAKKAREARGVLLLKDDESGQIYDAGMQSNGIDIIGKYGKKDTDANMRGANYVKNLSSTDALALTFYLDNLMKEGQLSNGFMPNEEVDLADTFFNSIVSNGKGAAQFFGSIFMMAAGTIGMGLGLKDEDGTNAAIKAADSLWKDMTTLDESDDIFKNTGSAGMNPYTEKVRNQQRSNLNHMIDTTFNLHYFDYGNTVNEEGQVVDKDGNVINIDRGHYNHVDQVKAFLQDATSIVGAVAEFAIESAATAGIGALVKNAAKVGTNLVGKAVTTAASKSPKIAKAVNLAVKVKDTTAKVLTTSLTPTAVHSAIEAGKAGKYIENIATTFGDDVAKGVAEGAIKNADDFVKATTKNAAKNIASKEATEETAKGVAEGVAKETAEETAKGAAKGAAKSTDNVIADNVDDITKKFSEEGGEIAQGVVENPETVVVYTADGNPVELYKANVNQIISKVQDGTKALQRDYAIRYAIDAVADNVDDASRAFSNRFLTKLEKFSERTHIFSNVNESVRGLISDSIANAASRAAVNGRLAAATGLSAQRIAALSDRTAAVLYGVLRASESGADNVSAKIVTEAAKYARNAAADVALGSIDFKKAATKIVEMSESLAKKGAVLSLDDVFRTLAIEGGTSTGALLNSLKLSQFVRDRVKDWSRDIAQNYWNPELDNRFESHYVDFETYINSPEQILSSVAFDAASTLIGKGTTRMRLNLINKKIDSIVASVDGTTPNRADAAKMRKNMMKLDSLRTKAVKLNNKILDGRISFEKVHSVSEKAEDAIKKHIGTIGDDLDMTKAAEMVVNNTAEAMDQAKAALAKGTRQGKREYRRILADADQINRMIIRGNDKLMAFQEVNNALQQVSITRYLDIESQAKTIHKLTGEQWGTCISRAWKKIKDIDFAKEFGEADEGSFTGYTINMKDKAKAKAAYAKGQQLVYNTIYSEVRAVMKDALSTSEYRELKSELDMIVQRMIKAGESLIDDGRKVRWNYLPTQALTWEAEPGTSSAVRALWGWDYKGGVHTSLAGEINAPTLARDRFDYDGIISAFDNGNDTFKRQKGNRAKEVERRKTGKTPEETRDVKFNWQGFDPAYATVAYLNSLDSARYVSPLLDPMNGIVVKNPKASGAIVDKINRIDNARLDEISRSYDKAVETSIKRRKAGKAASVSKESLARRAKLLDDFSNEKIGKTASKATTERVNKAEARGSKITSDIKQAIYNSPMITSLEELYNEESRKKFGYSISPENRKKFAVEKLNTAFNEMGQDIIAVREMYTETGKLKKKYLDADGNILHKYVDIQGNITPEGASATMLNPEATQYRKFVNQLAGNKNLDSGIFDLDNSHIIKFDDGAQINVMAFQKDLYDVLQVKQGLDLGFSPEAAQKALQARIKSREPKKLSKLEKSILADRVIERRLQPVDLDEVNARNILTKDVRKMYDSVYGGWNEYTQKYNKPSAKIDEIIQNAINNAYDEVEARGGQISVYEFAQEVDKHIPDFIKKAGKEGADSVTALGDALTLLKRYESAGGTNAELLADLRNAFANEADPAKKAILADAINTVKELDDFNTRTTGRAGLDYSLDDVIGEDDEGNAVTKGDITVDERTSGQQEGFANTYVPKGVDENLIGNTEGETRADIERKIAEIEDLELAAATSSEPDTDQQLKALGKERAELQKRLESVRDDSVIAADATEGDIDSAFAALDQEGKVSKETNAAYDAYKKAVNAPDKEPVAGVTEAKGVAEKQRLVELMNRDLSPQPAQANLSQKQSEEYARKIMHALTVLDGEVSGYSQNDISSANITLAQVSDDVKQKARDYMEAWRATRRNAYGDTSNDLFFGDADIEAKIVEATKPEYDALVEAIKKSSSTQAAEPTKKFDMDMSDNDIDSAFATFDQSGKVSKETSDAYDAYKKAINAPDKEPVAGVTEAKGVAEKQRLIELLNKDLSSQTAQTGANVETFKGNWTPVDVATSKDKVFLFGDNIEDAKTGYRPASTQAVIRGEENAIGIPTKKNRGTSAASYFTDADFDEFKTGVDDAIAKAKASGKTIVLPENGIGTGAAQLEKRAPKCFKYLQEQLDSLSTTSQPAQAAKSDRLHIVPANKTDAKAAIKGKYANKFIGYGIDDPRSATSNYAKQAGAKANVGEYGPGDSVFVSIPGKRGNATTRKEAQDATIAEAMKAIEDGATLITDSKAYINSSAYNEGEARLAKALKDKGYAYRDFEVEGTTIGLWRKPQDIQAGTFEASTAGHKEFSALNAKFAEGTKIMGIDIGGRTIEDVYQKELKGSGKGKAPAADSILGKATAQAEEKAGKALTKAEKEAISQRYYDRLWDIWGEQNPELKAQIENLPAGTKITDQFAKTGVSQANSLQRWVKPAQTVAPIANVNTSPAQKAINLKDSLDILNDKVDSKWSKRREYRNNRKHMMDGGEIIFHDDNGNVIAKSRTKGLVKMFNDIADEVEARAHYKTSFETPNAPLRMKDFSKDAFPGRASDIFPQEEISRNRKIGAPSPEEIRKRLDKNNVVLSRKTNEKLRDYAKLWRELEAETKAGDKSEIAKTKKKLAEMWYGEKDGKTLGNGLPDQINDELAETAQRQRVAQGKGIYRGSHILEGANDSQYLAFLNGDHTVRWKEYGDYVGYGEANSSFNNTVDRVEAKNAIIAGRDGFGNIEFMDPAVIEDYMKKHKVKTHPDGENGDWLLLELDEYKKTYNAYKNYILDPSHRHQVQDMTTSMSGSTVEFLSSYNSGDESSFAKSKGTNKVRDEAYRYKTYKGELLDRRVEREIEQSKAASKRVAEEIDASNDGSELKDFGDDKTMYDYTGAGTKERIDEIVDDRLSGVDDPTGEIRRLTLEQVLDENGLDMDKYEKLGTIESSRNREDTVYERDYNAEEVYLGPDERSRANSLPYIDYLERTKNINMSKESAKLNELFYGDGDKTGYFDAKSKINSDINESMAIIAENFDQNITDKVTELKKLDGAKDGEVIAILEAAKQQADAIENKTVRDYVVKRIDEEIAFASKSLNVDNPKLRNKIRQDFLDHDPEYKAIVEERKANAKKQTGHKISAQVPSGSQPLFVDGDITPDGHITLQQIVDNRREVNLSTKKSGKNNLKSSKQTREILSSMRKDFNDGYDGGSKISSGAARDQDTWILNLYTRIHNDSGLPKLDRNPTFSEIKEGKMKITLKDGSIKEVELPLQLSDIYIDPKIASLGSHYWGEGRATSVEKVYKMASMLSEFNKAVQDVQLAGGVGQFNAFTLRNAITMMWQDPIGGTRALFSNFYNARSNDSVINFYLNNHEKLLKMAIDTGDYSALNGFVNVVNMRDEVGGRGMIQDFGKQIADIPNVFKEKGIRAGFGENIKNVYGSIFENPTFVRWMVVTKADMQLRNYDHAKRFVGRIANKYGLTEDDFKNVEGGMGSMDRYIAHIAQMRTDKYWKPAEFFKARNSVEKYLDTKQKKTLKQTTESLRGMPQKKTLRSCLSDFFFAISYKLQMNAHPVDGIATIFTALPNDIRAGNALKNRTSFNVMSSRFAGRGNRNEALVMIGIAALAHAWNTYIGAPSAWEELWGDHGKVENGTYGLPQTLLNFQDFGKIWLPNTPEGKFDATQEGTAVDPFFSIFTLQNSAMRATNKFMFPNQIPYNNQRVLAQTDNQNLISRLQGVSDELIGANLLSGYKAIYEVLNNSTYFGNNIWERRYLPDGSENPNYNPMRNLMASVAHILNIEELWLGDTTNRWVKGLDIDTQTWRDGEKTDEPYSIGPKVGSRGIYNGKTGTVAGSGIIQHEFVTAWKKINDGDYFDALTEAMELPFKTRNYAARARTQLNTEVMMALRNAKHDYDDAVKNADAETKNQEYAKFAKKAVNIVHDWSAKNEYALGKNDELTASATKILVAFMADEYDDVSNKIQTMYDKLHQELKMAAGDEFLFSKEAMEAAIADGMDANTASETYNKHLTALKEAQIKEYDARQALIEAGIDPAQFETTQYIHSDLSAVDATFDKKTFKELTAKFEQPVGEFKNFEEMKNYYEELINNASTTNQKVKLANQYNQYVTDIIAPYVGSGFAAQAFNDIYWDGKNLSNELGKYVIIPADKYYTGKSPRVNYLKDLLGIGWRDNKNLPSDKDITDAISKVNEALKNGKVSSAGALVDNALLQLRKGTLHASPEDREKLIRMRALLSSRRK